MIQKYMSKRQQNEESEGDLERILQKEQTDEHGNRILFYYSPKVTRKSPEQSSPHVIWDYNLGRISPIQGFFSPYAPQVIVVGSILSPEKTQFVIAHETEHWRRHKYSDSQDEYHVDIAAKKSVGHDPYNRWGNNTQ